MTQEEQIKKLDAMAKPRSEEAIKKAEERRKQREDQVLLLHDLCARLPYHPICHIENENGTEIDDILTTSTIQNLDIWNVKPYLRPMSSMTEEEIKELGEVTLKGKMQGGLYAMLCPTHAPFDWLNAHYFDYRGLIYKGLAIEVTEDNNPYKD